MLGAVAFRLVVLAPSREHLSGSQALPGADETSAATGLLAAVLSLVALPFILFDEISRFRDPFSPFGAELDLLVTGTTWGRMWQLQLLSVVVALVAFAIVRVRPRGATSLGFSAPWGFAAASALFCATVPALSGHSAGTDRFHVLAVGADALHVVSAGSWLGALGVLVVVVRGATKRGAVTAEVLPALVASFSPLAILSAGTLVGTGLLATWLHVGSLGGLIGSTYGRILLAKVGLVGVAAGLGAYNWKRVTPRLGSPEGSKAFMAGSARSELVIGLLVLVLTAVLVVTPHPMD
jgi:putative copper export protein